MRGGGSAGGGSTAGGSAGAGELGGRVVPRAEELAQHDLQRRDDGDRDERADDAEQRGAGEDPEDHRQRVHVDGPLEDERLQDVVLDLLVDDQEDPVDDRRLREVREERDDEDDHAADRRADERDEAEEGHEHGERDGERHAEDRQDAERQDAVDRRDRQRARDVAGRRAVDPADDLVQALLAARRRSAAAATSPCACRRAAGRTSS